MTDTLYLTRAKLRRHAPAAALRELLVPDDDGRRAGAGHKLVWTLFADAPTRTRDFLWREAEAGLFYLLSRRHPEDRHQLFELDPPKVFAPVLSEGDRLIFSLRANATISRSPGPGIRGKPSDVVMDAIRQFPRGERAAERTAAIDVAGRRWLEAQGERNGFSLAQERTGAPEAGSGLAVTGYRTLSLDRSGSSGKNRPGKGRPARIGILDFEGELIVRDPERLSAVLSNGLGRAKAFGCGLMLVRRAR